MNLPPAPESSKSLLPRVFTLSSALRWLGHECPHRQCCGAPIDVMEASVWFLRGGRQYQTPPLKTRVVVESNGADDALMHILRLIPRVNSCTRRDGIEVRYRLRSAHDHLELYVPHPKPVVPKPGNSPGLRATVVEV